MLVAMELVLKDIITDSDGKPVVESDEGEYVAVFDTNVCTLFDDFLQTNQIGNDGIMNQSISFEVLQNRDDVVVLPKAKWETLHRMIKDNYHLTAKSESER